VHPISVAKNTVDKPVAQTTWQMYRSLALSVYLPSFLMSVCQSSVLLIIPLFALELDGGVGLASLVFALRGLGNMTADVPAGYAVSRIGDKYTMLVGVGIMTITGILSSLASSAWELAAAAFLFGSSMATWLVARLSFISDTIPGHQRGRAISSMAGLQRLGSLVGPVVSGFVVYHFGYQYVFIGIAVIAAMTFLLVTLLVPAGNAVPTTHASGFLKIVPQILGRHQRVFLTAGVAIVLLTMLRAGRQLLIPIWGESIGLDASEIGLIVGAAAAIDMMMFPIAGMIMDGWGRKHSAIACMAFVSLGLLFVPYTDSFVTLMLCAMVAGMGNGLGSGINATLGSDFALPHERGEFLGVWRLMGDSGAFAGPVVIGQIAAAFTLTAVYSGLAVVGLVGIGIVLVLVKETLPDKPQ
jgi:MFS family permease